MSRRTRVVFTDYDPTPGELCLHNARRQEFSRATGEVVDWRVPPRRTYRMILGCELLYEDVNHDLLLPLLKRLLAPGGVAWFGGRAARFCRLLTEAGFRYDLRDKRANRCPSSAWGDINRSWCATRRDDQSRRVSRRMGFVSSLMMFDA
jgi:hypothetical protein